MKKALALLLYRKEFPQKWKAVKQVGGFPGGTSDKELTCQCRRHKRLGFSLWVGKMPWRRAWQPTQVFLPRESHGQRSLVGYSPWGHKWLDTTEATSHLCTKQVEYLFSSVQFSHSVVSDSLRDFPNSCPSSQWCHPTISFSVISFSSCLQFFLASESFLMSQFFTSVGQSIGASASASVLPMNIQDWSLLGLTGLISLQSKGLSRVFSDHCSKASILQCSAFFIVQLSHSYMTTIKTIALTRWTFVGKLMSLLFNMLYRLVVAFLPRSKYLLIS